MKFAIPHVLAWANAQTWLCQEDKLVEIQEFLQARTGGHLPEELIESSMQSPDLLKDGRSIFTDADGRRQDVDGIRYLPINGVMMPESDRIMRFSGGTSTKQIISTAEEAAEDDSVRTLLMHIDSPGGAVSLVPEAAAALNALKKSKRVIAITEGAMASAAFWVGTSATKVFGSPSSQVGSHGVYRLHVEYTERNKEQGIAYEMIRAGELKGIGNPYEKLTASTREALQSNVDRIDEMFTAGLAENRNVSVEHVLDRFGRGRVFYAADALERGILDGVHTFAEVFDRERRRNSSSTTVGSFGGSKMKWLTPKTKAALFAHEFIDSQEVDDAVCVAAVRGMFLSSGSRLSNDATEEDVLGKISASTASRNSSLAVSTQTASQTTTGIDSAGNKYPARVVNPDRQLETEAAEGAERLRVKDIQLAGKSLNISADAILDAIESDLTSEDARAKFVKIAADRDEPNARIEGGPAQDDKFVDAVAGTFLEANGWGGSLTQEERESMPSLRFSHPMQVAETAVLAANGGSRTSGDPEQIAHQFLMGSFTGSGQAYARELMADNPSVNRLGDHPDALSNVMGRMLDITYAEANTTWESYSTTITVPDNRPKSFIETGVFQELDALDEDEKKKQLQFLSNLKAWVQAADFGNKVCLTTKMIINDDIGIFLRQLSSLMEAAVYTVDNGVRAHLLSNPTMADGAAMFSTARGNLVETGSGGGAPSETTSSLHRKKHRTIKGFGSTRPMMRGPNRALVPAALEQASLQTWAPRDQVESKTPTTDATINTVRRTITPIMDGMLDASSETRWWTFIGDPNFRPMIVGFIRGYGGARGKRTTWIDPETGGRNVGVDLKAGHAPYNFRSIVQNNGA